MSQRSQDASDPVAPQWELQNCVSWSPSTDVPEDHPLEPGNTAVFLGSDQGHTAYITLLLWGHQARSEMGGLGSLTISI